MWLLILGIVIGVLLTPVTLTLGVIILDLIHEIKDSKHRDSNGIYIEDEKD